MQNRYQEIVADIMRTDPESLNAYQFKEPLLSNPSGLHKEISLMISQK